ncbi:hypothetical protein DFQ30_006127, partial [Apophysomyces sp. BC1015]
AWISDAFQRYQFPAQWGQECVDPIDGHAQRFQSRFLGVSCLQFGSRYFFNASFYEITESEISEIAFPEKKSKHQGDDTFDQEPECSPVSTIEFQADLPEVDACCGLVDGFSTNFFGPEKPLTTLPPKKRKRRKIIHYDVVFCFDTPPTIPGEDIQLSPEHEYFLFPHDAIVEAVKKDPPFEVMFSFHLPTKSSASALHSLCSCNSYTPEFNPRVPSYKSKLEEFAAVCSTSYHLAPTSPTSPTSPTYRTYPQRRFTDPGLLKAPFQRSKTEHHVLNMRISDVSRDLYTAIKQVVSGFEIVYEKMMELMRLHRQQVACQKAEIRLRPEVSVVDQPEVEINEKIGYNHRNPAGVDQWSSSDENSWEKGISDSNAFDEDRQVTSDSNLTSPKAGISQNGTLGSPQSITASLSSNSTKQHSSRALSSSSSLKKCLYCGSKSTPMWRRGPQGAGTLCNACGVKWKHGKILCGTDTSTVPAVPAKERKNVAKGEKKRKKSGLAKKDKRPKVKDTKKRGSMQTTDDDEIGYTHQYTEDEEMESNIDAARNLSIYEDDDEMISSVRLPSSASDIFSMTPAREFGAEMRQTHSWSSGPDFSNFVSSKSSPPVAIDAQHRHKRRHTTDMSIMEKMGFNGSSISVSAGVDAVEAATVLTLLKRS